MELFLTLKVSESSESYNSKLLMQFNLVGWLIKNKNSHAMEIQYIVTLI